MEKNKKVLFVDTAHESLKLALENYGFQCDYFPKYKRADFEKCIGEYFGVIIRSKIQLDKEILNRAVNLKFIGRVGAGMESIDLDYAEKKGIACFNSPEGSRDAVGEHTIGILLALMNNICFSDKQVRQGIRKREENRGIEIKGKTIGIIGYGNMGSAFAQRLKSFDVEVIAYDKYKTDYSSDLVKEETMKSLFESVDILSLHVPLTVETYYLVDDLFLNKFKKEIFLINTARGPVVKTDDLVENLKSGKVRGAALDVLEYESFSFEKFNTDEFPESYKYLISADNVVLNPHIAGLTKESYIKLSEVLAEKIIKFLKENNY
ncbi:MAG: hydroxyacid dehydrogenase [Bacteroidetes bacterium]|nr:hydroxyacid dehydrogenase [Bacteroidota bacterium]